VHLVGQETHLLQQLAGRRSDGLNLRGGLGIGRLLLDGDQLVAQRRE
jgi:hypothetical protein